MSRRGKSLKRMLLLVSVALVLPACVAPHYSNCQIIGAKPCQISKPSQVEFCLDHQPSKPVGFVAAITGCVTTPFKCIGIFGWTDYGYNAEATGKVVQARLSSDRFFTVDLMLKRLNVGNAAISEACCRFIRAEVYQGNTPVPKDVRDLSAPTVLIRGKLVWDGDGHLEIHPQSAADYRVISSRAND